MQSNRIALVHCAVLSIVLGAAAGARGEQAPSGSPEARERAGPRAYLSINGGAQITRTDFLTSLSFPLYGEEAAVEGRHDVPAGPLIDVGAGVRLVGGLAVGAAVTRYQQRGSATIDARLPHPLLPDQPRSLVETVVDLDRVETTVHAYVAWLVPAGDHLTVAVFGGATFFRVEQDFISALELDEAYPFDEVALGNALTAQADESTTGFNVGTDVMYRVKGRIGVGGVARYSRGTLDGEDIRDLRTGGLHLSGGIRWFF